MSKTGSDETKPHSVLFDAERLSEPYTMVVMEVFFAQLPERSNKKLSMGHMDSNIRL